MARLYRFLTGPDDASFCHKITQALNEGWELYGNPVYVNNSTSGEFNCGQAVIKNTKGEYDPELKLRDQ